MNQYTRTTRPYTRAQFIQCYSDMGMTLTEIALHFGVGRKIAQTDLRAFGIPARTAAPRSQSGESNANWKGDCVSYRGAHARVRRLRGEPSNCSKCGNIAHEWASISKQHDNPADYNPMCRSCHRKTDGAIDNIAK